MDQATITADTLTALAELDTPTVCNALEVVAPERRTIGFNREPLLCPGPRKSAIVGHARTARIRSRAPNDLSADQRQALRMQYYEYIEAGPAPSIAVIQDLDCGQGGLGAFWGEVQSNIHKGLGCLGVVTDGAVRDIDMMAPDFFVLAGAVVPSHVWADLVDFDTDVSVAGMAVAPGDLVHADRHGCVVVPASVAGRVAAAAATIAAKEGVILEAARAPGFTAARLRRAIADSDDIH